MLAQLRDYCNLRDSASFISAWRHRIDAIAVLLIQDRSN